MPNKKTPPSADTSDIDQFYRQVGFKIREARKSYKNRVAETAKGELTQEALAASAGLKRTSVTNVEKGRQKLLLHTFTQIASALKVQPAELLPDSSEVLQSLGLNLPKTLRADERGFIENTMSPGGANEKFETKNDSRRSNEALKGKRGDRGSR